MKRENLDYLAFLRDREKRDNQEKRGQLDSQDLKGQRDLPDQQAMEKEETQWVAQAV